MRTVLLLLLVLVALIALPIILRPHEEKGEVARSLAIISPHNEAIRHEFGRAFEAYHLRTHRERVSVEWRTPGGTAEISRYLKSEYVAAFQHHWVDGLHQPWSLAVEKGFDSAAATPAATGQPETPEQAARRDFLASNIGCGIDLFFGGGSFDFIKQAGDGRLVDSGVVKAHPELFGPGGIPQTLGGEPYWDPQGRWIGACLSAFGICWNRDVLRAAGLPEPRRWGDLADSRYRGRLALANPTQSGSVNKAFEMLIQQQMLERSQKGGDEKVAVAEGWANALRLLRRVGANARYFASDAQKVSLDVASGDAAAGMTIDFFGRFESEAVRRPDGSSRLGYADAEGGTSFGVDPVGMLRGAPQPDLAREFIEWALSPEAQKLWNWKVGAPGGPQQYALRRLPVLPALYRPEFRSERSDPDVNPYTGPVFVYHGKWTGPLFDVISFTVRTMCIDSHEELTQAWNDLVAAGMPPEATAEFDDVRTVDYATILNRIKPALAKKGLPEIELARELGDGFRAQYRHVSELARARK
jgi:ABC-type Fe3+ transport system substrate-binding protein